MHDYVTGSIVLDRLVYSFMGLRIIAYTYFLILNSFQTFLEVKRMIREKKKSTTRFFVFFNMAIFCAFRDIQTAYFYSNPDLGLKTANFFFFSLGTITIFLTWVFIHHYWLLIMYKFFISEEVRLNRSKPINYSTFIFASILIIYQFTVSSLTLYLDMEVAESVGFLILLLIYAGLVFFNGYYLLRHLKKNKKSTPFSHFDVMILKTKILLATLVYVVVFIVIQELIFNMYYTDTYETPRQYLKLFVVGVIEFSQMIVVMLVLSNGNWKNYVLFKKIKLLSDTSESDNSKGRKHSTYDSKDSNNNSTRNTEIEISIDIDNAHKAKELKNNSTSDLRTSCVSFNNSSSGLISMSVDTNNQD